jgi:hypothetical protein
MAGRGLAGILPLRIVDLIAVRKMDDPFAIMWLPVEGRTVAAAMI